MKKFLLTVAVLATVSVNAGKMFPEIARKWYPQKFKKSAAKRFQGPFAAGEIDFYIVHHGGDLKVTLTAKRSKLNGGPVSRALLSQAIFYRFFDAQERPVKKQFFVFPEGKGIKEKSFNLQLKKASAGIYQLRCAMSQNSYINVDIKTAPVCSFGVAASRGFMLPPVKKQFADSYIYTPVDCEQLKFRFHGATGELFDLNGKSLIKMPKSKVYSVNVEPDKVYKLNAVNVWRGFGIDGAPGILCPDAATARNIRGSVEFAPDGMLLYHKFQVRNWKWMHSLKKDQLIAPPVADLRKYKKEFLAAPGSETLVGQAGVLSHAGYLFKTQNLDPKSQDFGDGRKLYYLSMLWGIDAPFNPYAGNKNILNRFFMNVYGRHMKLKENGTFVEGYGHYSGGDALSTLSTYISYYLYGKKVPSKFRAPWRDSIAMLIDRFGMDRVGCENQTAHWLIDLECMYQGGAGKVYGDMAKDFALHLCTTKYNPYLKAGYLQENYAADATYNGLSASNVAFYYMLSGDKNAKDALKRIYNLFNHTVAQEPDGTPYGASAFAHRTTGSWKSRQWNGGTNLMQNELAGAGVWAKHAHPKDPPELFLRKYLGWKPNDDWYKANSRWAVGYVMSPWLGIWRGYFNRDTKLVEGEFPVTASNKFTGILDDKFYCFREPSYYAFAFTSKDWYDWVKRSRKIIPFNPRWKKEGNTLTPVTAVAKKNRWTAIQGLMMFWTPQYGNFILAKNWNIYTGQFVRAELAGGKVSWPDYWSVKSSYNAKTRILTIQHNMINMPITCKRDLTFGAKEMRVALTLTFTGDVNAKALVEQLPFLKKTGMKLDIKPGLAVFTNASGKGIKVKLDKPLKMRTGLESDHHKQTIGSLLIVLGGKHKKGKVIKLNYTLSAI
jgi:hypothetical protein